MKNGASSQFVWQTLFAILLGVVTGWVLLSFTHKRPAEAVTKGGDVPAQITPGGIQILPTLNQRMTLLLMGVDSNGRNTERFTNTRSDTMIVASLDPATGKVGIVSIPRDSRVQIAGREITDKINSAHALGGPELAVQTVTEQFGVPINHYVVVDTQALKELCQLLGPVEVLVEKEMHYHDWAAHLHIDLKPGLQTLTPEQVEQYVRYRHDAKGDVGRMERQQWFFRAAAKKLRDPQFLLRLPDLIRMAHDYVRTDLSMEDMARIATFAKDVRPDEVVTATLPGAPEMINGGSYWVPNMEAARVVFNRIAGLSGGGAFVDGPETPEAAIEQAQHPDASPESKQIKVAIRYPKGAEASARGLETLLNNAGYNVKYLWQTPVADCRHEQIVQMSARAGDGETRKLKQQFAKMSGWPIVLQLEQKPLVDFTVVVSPDVDFAIAPVASSEVAQPVPTGARPRIR